MQKSLQFIELQTPAFTLPGSDTTWRWAIPTDYLHTSKIEAIPSIASISYTPAVLSLGKDLGTRSSLTITFKDHKHIMASESFDSGTFFGKFRARYGQKLRGRLVTWYKGYLGDPLAGMERRFFYVDSVDGPTPDGTYTIIAKDLLKFADDERAVAPRLSNGSLLGAIDNDDAAFTLNPSGIGNAEYPSSGYVCLGGKEIVAFTRSGDTMSITRAQMNTDAINHEAGERAQLVLYYDGDDVADIIRDLLVTYANIPGGNIPLAAWQAETAANLGGIIYARAITEPTPVNTLVSELIEQAGLVVWWDDLAALVQLQVLKEIGTDAASFSEDIILMNSLKVKEQPNTRISQIWTYYQQRNPTDRGDDEDNYRSSLLTVDGTKETEYGSPVFRAIKGQWVATLNAAQRVNQLQLSRFADPPRRYNFDLFPGTAIAPGQGARLVYRQNQNTDGTIVSDGAPIQVVSVAPMADGIRVEAEEMLVNGDIVITNTVILNTVGAGTWTVPADWNSSNNTIEVIAGGGAGSASGSNSGGGGGAYSRITNLSLTPSASVNYSVGAGGVAATNAVGGNGGDTWFNGTSLGSASISAQHGSGGTLTAGIGGAAASGIGTVKFSGGNGGNVTSGDDGGGAGGGGAAGPNGNGAAGAGRADGDDGGGGGGGADGGAAGTIPDGDVGGVGGPNRLGTGGGNLTTPNGFDGGGGRGGDQESPGTTGTGSPELIWTQTIAPIISAGPSGGAGGPAIRENGISAVNYGGGGSGAGDSAGSGPKIGGNGAQGVIVITWTP